VDPQLSVQTLLVPLALYRGLRATQDDLAVFNAAGEAVPFALRTLQAERAREEQEIDVPIFPIQVREADAASPQALHLRVERDAAGTVVDIAVPETKRTKAQAKLVSYVLDTSKLEQAATRLKLALEFGPDSLTTKVSVEASDDLAAWSTLASGVVIGQLSHAGQRIQRSEIELTPARSRVPALALGGRAARGAARCSAGGGA
jgi:hypothetical protein